MMGASKIIGIVVLIVVPCAWVLIAVTGEPRLPIGIANGIYSNRCCGTMVLANGIMTTADTRISYVIERDKVGPYVLPKAYIGASNDGFVMRSKGYPLKLRLNDPARPQQIELPDDGPGGQIYSFVRESGN